MQKVDIRQHYFMDDPREGERLERKVNPDEFVRKYLGKFIIKLESASILEAGCGPGALLEVLARNYKHHEIIGIDISDDRVKQANSKMPSSVNAKAIQANIYKLPFPDNYFDFIYSRFLYEYLQDPIMATKELHRVCKPGGKILLQDLDGQFTFYPELSDGLDRVLKLLRQQTGFDVNIGRKLFFIGRTVGLSFLDAETEIYHKVFGKIDDLNYELWNLKLEIAFKNLKERVQFETDNLKYEILESLLNLDSVMFSTLFTLVFEKVKTTEL